MARRGAAGRALTMTTDNIEREIKLAFASAAEARGAIAATGATPLLGRRLQQDALFDAGDTLRTRGCALRVRSENGQSRITFKGPIQPSAMKLRDEFETIVGNGSIVTRILEELGFAVWFRYEKFREEFSHPEVVIAIDETPVGVFVELEGSEDGITAVATALGRAPADYILESYRGLFETRGPSAGLRGSDMVFDPPRR